MASPSAVSRRADGDARRTRGAGVPYSEAGFDEFDRVGRADGDEVPQCPHRSMFTVIIVILLVGKYWCLRT